MIPFITGSKIPNYYEDTRGKDLKTWSDIQCSPTGKLNSLKM